MSKQNDLFLNILANPDMTMKDFMTVGFTADNTGMESEDYYKNNSHVQEVFSKNGSFDETAFHNAYQSALQEYNLMSKDSYEQALMKQVEFVRDDIFAPPMQRKTGPDIELTLVPNPLRQQSSIVTLGRLEAPKKTIDEIAQGQKVYDPETDTWDEAPVTGDGINTNFFKYFTDTLVLAQWDEDGTHTDLYTGQEVNHKKGDLKLNDEGTYYYEKLAGRDVYGRRVLNKLNVLTTEDSELNKYDFFDSDDIHKSIGGTLLKNVALIGSMFLPYGIGATITGLNIAVQATGFLSTLGKMFLGSDSPTLSALEGWAQSMDRQGAKSEYAQQNMWCWENMINLIGDVAGQLREQRFLFKEAPALFLGKTGRTAANQEKALATWTENLNKENTKKVDDYIEYLSNKDIIEGKDVFERARQLQILNSVNAKKAQTMLDEYMKTYNKLGSVISKAYMTAITTESMYGEAKLAGASDLEATLLTLGYAAGEAWILNTGIGEHILPELKEAELHNKALLRSAFQSIKGIEAQSVKQAPTKAEKMSIVKKLFNKGKQLALQDHYTGDTLLKNMLSHALGEGVEEVSEELLADFSRSCYDLVQWIQGDESRMMKWDLSEMFDRYAMSLVGGFVGGGINAPFMNYKPLKNLNNIDRSQAMQEIIYMARNGKTGELRKTLNKVDTGDKNLSYRMTQDSNGNIVYEATKDYKDSQDYANKQLINKLLDNIENIIQAEGVDIKDEPFLDIQTLKDIRFQQLQKSVTAGKFLQDFNTLSTQLVETVDKLNALNANQTDLQERNQEKRKENGTETVNDQQQEQQKKELEDKLKDLRKQRDAYLNGDMSPIFVRNALFEMISPISDIFTKLTFKQYAEHIEKKDLDNIPDNRKEELYKEYENYRQTEAKDDINTMAQAFQDISSQVSELLTNHANQVSDVNQSIKGLSGIYQYLLETSKTESGDLWLNNTASILQQIPNSVLIDLLQNIPAAQDIINVYNQDPNKEDPQKQEQLRHELLNIAVINTNQLFQPIIDQGFIHSEIKPIINKLLNDIYFYAEDNGFFNEVGYIGNLLTEFGNLGTAPIEQQLDEFSQTLTNKPFKVTELISTINGLLRTKKDLSEFTISKDVRDQIEEASNLIQLYRASIQAANTDASVFTLGHTLEGQVFDSTDVWGYNKVLNELNKDKEGWKQLAEIDSNSANVILQNLDLIEGKLKFAKALFDINNGQKLNQQNRVSLNRDYVIFNKLKKFIVTIPDDWKGKSDLIALLESSTTLSEKAKDRQLEVTEDEKEKILKERIAVEDAIYAFFEANKDRDLKELINPKNLDIFNKNISIFNDSSEDIDDNAFMWWLASRAAIKSSDFYWQFKQIITDAVAPLPIQEMAVYQTYAQIVNGKVFNDFFNAIRESAKEYWSTLSKDQKKALVKDPNIQDTIEKGKFDNILSFGFTPTFSNISLIEGIAGSGKTSAVFYYIKQMLGKFNPELLSNTIIAHGANKDSAKNIAENVLQLNNAKVFDRKSLMEYISKGWHDYTIVDDNVKVDPNDYFIDENGQPRTTFEVNALQDTPKVIFIDEISQFSFFDLDLIDKFAKQYGITIIAAGDYDQSGIYGKYDLDEHTISTFEAVRQDFARTLKNGVSIRANNSQKVVNMTQLQALIVTKKGQATIHHHKDDRGLFGDRIYYRYEDSIEKEIDFLIQTSGDTKIGYIYYSQDTPLYKLLTSDKYKDKVIPYLSTSAQGLESKYYIAELNPKLTDTNLLKDLNTAMTRAQQGSIIITNNGNDVSFVTEEDDDTNLELISEDAIKIYSQKTKVLFDKVIPDGNKIQYQEFTAETTPPPPPKSEGQGLDPAVEPPSNNDGGQSNGEDQSNDNNEQANDNQQQSNNQTQPTLPIINTNLQSEQEYQDKIDNSSSDNQQPKVENSELNILFHSFNTFESGMQHDGERVIADGRTPSRIDSMNGLFNLDQKRGRKIRTYSQYLNIIGNLRSILLSTSDKAKLVETIQRVLGLQDTYITFGFKSSAGISKGNTYGTTNPNYYRMDKSIEEQLEFMYSNDTRSKEISRKSLVAIIGTKKDGDILELPLLTLSSPYTIMQLKDGNGNYIFQNILNAFLNRGKKTDYQVREELVKNKSQYSKLEQQLINMFQLYNFTTNGIFFINDNSWTPSNNLESLGPQFVTHKGSMQLKPGFSYDADGVRDADWITLEELRKNNSFKVSPVLSSRFSTIDGYPKPIVHAGHPFVLITNDKSIGDLGAYYAAQFTDPDNHPKKVKLVYILPPSASFQEWIDQKYAIINQGTKFTNYIGNDFTSYNILKLAIQNEEFVEIFKQLFPKSYETVINKVNELNNMTQEQRNVALFENTQIGIYPVEYPLFKIFNNILKEMVYTHNTDGSVGNNYNVVEIVQGILDSNNYKIYYDPSLPNADNLIYHGPFLQVIQDVNSGTIDGRHCRIHGKIDSAAFRGSFVDIIKDIIENKIRKGNRGGLFSTDNHNYLLGDSDLSNQLENPYTYVFDRLRELGIKLPADITSDKDNYLEQVKSYINRMTNSIAFISGDKLYISEEHSVLNGNCLVSDTIIENRTTKQKYNYTIENGQIILTAAENKGSEVTLSMTDANAETYLSIVDKPLSISDSGIVVNNLDELKTYISSAKEIIGIEVLTDNINSELQDYPEGTTGNTILKELLNYIQTSDEQNIQDTCAVEIKLKL